MSKTPAKLFAIGDVHGYHDRLTTLLERIPYSPESDTLVFLGDLINKGPDSFKVVELVCELSKKGRVVSLLGNHEHLLLEYQASVDSKLIPYLRELGIESTLESYGRSNLSRIPNLSFMPEHHRKLFHSLVPYWETESFIFVHAGMDPKVELQDQSLFQLTGMRDFHLAKEDLLQKTVVFGHRPFQTPFVSNKKIGIDTGVAYQNLLTAVELPARVFYHA